MLTIVAFTGKCFMIFFLFIDNNVFSGILLDVITKIGINSQKRGPKVTQRQSL